MGRRAGRRPLVRTGVVAGLLVPWTGRRRAQAERGVLSAALCLRDAPSQKFAALCGGAPPAIKAIYFDESNIDPCPGSSRGDRPSVVTAFPMRDVILRALRNAAVRPATPAYQNLSAVTAKLLSPPAAIDPSATAQRLRDELAKAITSRGCELFGVS